MKKDNNKIDTKKLREILLKDEIEKFTPTKLSEKMTPSEIRFEIEFPIMQLHIKEKNKEPEKYNSSTERCICPQCNGSYPKGCMSYHRKRKRHKLYEHLNKQLMELFKTY